MTRARLNSGEITSTYEVSISPLASNTVASTGDVAEPRPRPITYHHGHGHAYMLTNKMKTNECTYKKNKNCTCMIVT
jgi:hypothetical protein